MQEIERIQQSLNESVHASIQRRVDAALLLLSTERSLQDFNHHLLAPIQIWDGKDWERNELKSYANAWISQILQACIAWSIQPHSTVLLTSSPRILALSTNIEHMMLQATAR
jgi:hypothetical protein